MKLRDPDWLQDRRLFTAEELEQIVAARATYGEMTRLAKRINRVPQAVYAKAHQLADAAKARRRCGAFLPDNGLPYTVVAHRLLTQG